MSGCAVAVEAELACRVSCLLPSSRVSLAEPIFRQTGSDGGEGRRDPRSRSNTAHAYADRFNAMEEEPLPVAEARPSIRSTRAASSQVPPESPRKETTGYDFSSARPNVNRATTFQGPTQVYRDCSPSQRVSRVPNDNLSIRNQRSQLRPLAKASTENDLFSDPSDDSTFHSNSSPDRSYKERSASPATSHDSAPPSRNASYSTLNAATNSKKQAPPPPPSRAKKPPPPPPPMSTYFRIHSSQMQAVP
jgi:hypothetical protein